MNVQSRAVHSLWGGDAAEGDGGSPIVLALSPVRGKGKLGITPVRFNLTPPYFRALPTRPSGRSNWTDPRNWTDPCPDPPPGSRQ